jgi:hypothetical protein
MAFLTVFSAPKPFTNPHIRTIQRNAVESWRRLPDTEVILIGDEPGIPETARELGVRNVPLVKRDSEGIPLVSAVMEIGHAKSNSPLLCYANGDMLLMSDLMLAARQVAKKAHDFLIIGQRWNLDITESLDFNGDWESRLRLEVARRGQCYTPWGIDYFVFPRHLYTQTPDFTIGRVAWDNWMVYHARTTFDMAIDASREVLAVHQNHDYSHIPAKTIYKTEVAISNLAKSGGRKCIYNMLDTNRELVGGRIRRPRLRMVRLLRQMEHLFINDKGRGWSWEISLRLQKLQRELGSNPRR